MTDKIEHYGILGMRWGVRRSQATLDRIAGRTSSGERPSKAEQDRNRKAARKARNKSVRSERRSASRNRRNLTTAEIKERINRLEDEKKLKQLTNENIAPLQTKLVGMLSDAGWDVGKNVSKAALTVLTRKYIAGETLTRQEIGKYLKAKK